MLSLPNALLIVGVIIATAVLAPLMVDRFQPAGTFVVDGKPGVLRMNPRTGVVIPCLVIPDPTPRSKEPAEQYYVQCRDF